MKCRRLLAFVGVVVVLVLPLVLPKALTPSADASPIFFLPWRGGQTWKVTSGNCSANHACDDVWNAYAWDFVPNSGATNEVVAVADGTVCYVQNSVPDSAGFSQPHSGNVIVIVHEGTCAEWCNGVYSSYHHLQQGTAAVSNGSVVRRGTVIARQGNSGYSFGPHLHFSIYSQYGRVTSQGWQTVAGRTMAARFADAAAQADGGIPRAGRTYNSDNYQQPTNTSPTGFIDAPPAGSTQVGTVRIGGWAEAAGSSIIKVEIWIDGRKRADALLSQPRSDGKPGWHWDWNTTLYGNGTYSLQVKALAANGASSFLPGTVGTTFQIIVRNATPTEPPPSTACLKPILRYQNESRQKHFYTSDWNELQGGRDKWLYEGFEGYIASSPSCYAPNAQLLYRMWHDGRQKHFYTTSLNEVLAAEQLGFVREAALGYVLNSANDLYHTQALYRRYKTSIDNHFYTASTNEAASAVTNSGYQDEGIAAYVFHKDALIPLPAPTSPVP